MTPTFVWTVPVRPLLATALLFSTFAMQADPIGSTSPLDSVSLPEGRSLDWNLILLDKHSSTPVTLQSVRSDEGKWIYASGNFEINVSANLHERGYTEVTVQVTNKGDEELWLEPRLSITLPGKEFEWFDGYQVRKVFSRRETLTGSLPFISYQQKDYGIALGIDPREMVSHFRGALKKLENDNASLEFSSRLVVPANGEETRRFAIFGYQPDFGYLNAVQKYWDFFPECYRAHDGISPDVKGPVLGNIVWMNQHFQFHDGPKGKFNDKVSEIVRWIGGGWEWCYMGYGTRPGDWLCTEEISFDWKVNPKDPKSPEKTTALRDVLGRSAKEHLEGLMGNYRRLDALGVAPLMYIIPSYCESELAEEKYSDSIYYDPQGEPRSSGPPWVGAYDRSYQMYSYGNRFGDYTEEAIKVIAERTPGLRGFSFDCIDRANFNYTGPGLERSPGKAYDEKLGVYVNMEIAHAKFGELVHSIEKDGYRFALSGNFRASSGSYLAAQAMDAAVIEHTPWDERPLPNVIRLHLGTKSVSFLHGYERVPEIEGLSAEELINTAQMLQDFTILQSLRYGIYPSWKSALGSPKMIHYFEIFNDLFRNYGWQPTPGARGHEELWISRYGSSPGSILNIGNATEKEIASQVDILPEYFGGSNVAFVDYEGISPVETKLEKGKQNFHATLAPGSTSLYATALMWKEPFKGSVIGRRSQIVGERATDYFDLTPVANENGTGKSKTYVPERPGYQIVAIRLGGEELTFSRDGTLVTFEHPLRKGLIEIDYIPTIGTSYAKELKKVGFLDEKKAPTFQIVLLEDTPFTRREATKINSFFSSYSHGIDNVDGVIKAPIRTVEGETDPNRLTIYIGTEATRMHSPFRDSKPHFSKGEIIAGPNVIGLFAEDDKQLTDTGNLFLKLLTESYPHYGRFHISSKSIPGGAGVLSPSLFQKVTGMDYLPWEKKNADIQQ